MPLTIHTSILQTGKQSGPDVNGAIYLGWRQEAISTVREVGIWGLAEVWISSDRQEHGVRDEAVALYPGGFIR